MAISNLGVYKKTRTTTTIIKFIGLGAAHLFGRQPRVYYINIVSIFGKVRGERVGKDAL